MADVHRPVADVLNAAADLIEPEGRWTQGVLGRRDDGTPILAATPEGLSRASCYCMAGALWVANGYRYPEKAFDALLGEARHGTGSWNDAPERTQAEVVQALRDAAKASSKGPSDE